MGKKQKKKKEKGKKEKEKKEKEEIQIKFKILTHVLYVFLNCEKWKKILWLALEQPDLLFNKCFKNKQTALKIDLVLWIEQAQNFVLLNATVLTSHAVEQPLIHPPPPI